MADAPNPAPVEVPPEAEDRRNAQIKEYGVYVAVEQIYVGNALAYDVGHPVPASNVELHGYADAGLVAKRTTKEGKAALGQAG